MTSRQPLRSLELRNYALQAGSRQAFHRYFATHFVAPMEALGGYTLGQFALQGQDDNFCWLRGFEDVATRSAFLPAFYEQSSTWKVFGPGANAMMVDSDNVHWLQPLQPTTAEDLLLPGGAVIDFYEVRPGHLMRLADQLRTAPATGQPTTWWVSETANNDFPRLPVFQHAHLLVAIGAVATEPPRGQAGNLRALPDALPETVTAHHQLLLQALPELGERQKG